MPEPFVSGNGSLDVDGSQDVVGEDGKSHFGSGSFQVSGQEPSTCRHSLDRTERMLDGTSPSFTIAGMARASMRLSASSSR